MKKLLLALLVLVNLKAVELTEKEYGSIYIEDLQVAYSPKSKKCELLTSSERMYFFREYRDNNLIINGHIIKWDNNSKYFPFVQNDRTTGKLYYYDMFNNMDICNAFVKILGESK